MIRKYIYDFLINTEQDSFITKLRRKRFILFESFVKGLNLDEVKLLDIGGTQKYWEQVYDTEKNPLNLKITLYNRRSDKDSDSIFEFHSGDARCLDIIEDNAYDICFSNSMIEHVGDLTQQFLAVSEMKRVAKHIYLQTPNFYFPLEPHYQLFFVHWLPFPLKIKVLKVFYKAKNVYDMYLDDPVNLLTKHELHWLFKGTDYNLTKERLFFLTKSYVVIAST